MFANYRNEVFPMNAQIIFHFRIIQSMENRLIRRKNGRDVSREKIQLTKMHRPNDMRTSFFAHFLTFLLIVNYLSCVCV